jgi:hypothetical protein
VRLARPLLRYFALRIFRQDAWILARQTATIERFGEENYKFTPLDVLGAEIYDLLRHGRATVGPTPAARSIRMLV